MVNHSERGLVGAQGSGDNSSARPPRATCGLAQGTCFASRADGNLLRAEVLPTDCSVQWPPTRDAGGGEDRRARQWGCQRWYTTPGRSPRWGRCPWPVDAAQCAPTQSRFCNSSVARSAKPALRSLQTVARKSFTLYTRCPMPITLYLGSAALRFQPSPSPARRSLSCRSPHRSPAVQPGNPR